MRRAFVKALCELAQRDKRVLLLTADLGYFFLEPFRDAFPQQFFNVGVSEQNMVGVATGLAEAGYIPYVYSIAPFATLRPFEFIRNGPIAHQLPVRIIGIGGGFDYGVDGLSHYALEDISLMRTEQGISVVVPADAPQAYSALVSTYDLPHPIYFRIAKAESPDVSELQEKFKLGRAHLLKTGRDVLFIVTGNLVAGTLEAAQELSKQGIDSGVLLLSSIVPAPINDILHAIGSCDLVVTVESHYINGGIGSLVAEVMAEKAMARRLFRCGVRTLTVGPVGTQSYMNQLSGLGKDQLIETVLSLRATKT